ncbi:hypothetical protein H7F35_05300 [Variovorax sp. PAMC26660]|nr:hypothetical protein H7F35_05300 [Variovorax sp. PAMC26660]
MGEVFSHISPDSKRTMRAMNPDTDLPLLLSLVLRFWLVAHAWVLLVRWAEARVTRPTVPSPGSIEKETS